MLPAGAALWKFWLKFYSWNYASTLISYAFVDAPYARWLRRCSRQILYDSDALPVSWPFTFVCAEENNIKRCDISNRKIIIISHHLRFSLGSRQSSDPHSCNDGISWVALLACNRPLYDQRTRHSCNIWAQFVWIEKRKSQWVRMVSRFKRRQTNYVPRLTESLRSVAIFGASVQIGAVRANDECCFDTFIAVFCLEIDHFIFAQWAESTHSQHTLQWKKQMKRTKNTHTKMRKLAYAYLVHEHILWSIVWCNESPAFCYVEPFALSASQVSMRYVLWKWQVLEEIVLDTFFYSFFLFRNGYPY